jgi:hypothetical protein
MNDRNIPSKERNMEQWETATRYGRADLTLHPLVREAYKVACLIERCGASPDLTAASSAAFDLCEKLGMELETSRALFNKGIGVLKENRFSFSFENAAEAERAFHYVADIGTLQTSQPPKHPETNGDGWIACSDRMPTHGLKVMAYFLNKLGKGRTVFANHIEKFKERADNYEIDPDTPDDWFDTDESGESYIPEGWYENSETHEQELGITDEILFWRPLLSPPEQVKTSTEPACEKCKTLLAFEDDVCWACSKEER